MEESTVLKQIDDILLKAVRHKDKPNVIFAMIDASVSDKEEEGIVNYLNIYGCTITNGYNFDTAYKKAIKYDDLGYVTEILKYVVRSDFEIKIASLFSNSNESVDDKIIETINKTLNTNKEAFNQIKKLYFHWVFDSDFVKIIDKPA